MARAYQKSPGKDRTETCALPPPLRSSGLVPESHSRRARLPSSKPPWNMQRFPIASHIGSTSVPCCPKEPHFDIFKVLRTDGKEVRLRFSRISISSLLPRVYRGDTRTVPHSAGYISNISLSNFLHNRLGLPVDDDPITRKCLAGFAFILTFFSISLRH